MWQGVGRGARASLRRPIALLAALAPSAGLTLSSYPAMAQSDIWSATLTVKDSMTIDGWRGCDNDDPGIECTDGLTDDSFTVGTTDYQVTRVTVHRRMNDDALTFALDTTIPVERLFLQVGAREFDFRDATLHDTGIRAQWNGIDVNWTELPVA